MRQNPHGGDIYTKKCRVDFSVNVNPLGAPESVKEAVRKSAESVEQYPDALCRDLTRAAHQKDTELDENLPAPEELEDGSVLDAVRALPENYRNAIYLHYYEGYTAAEIGRMMGAPSNTVLSWLRRGRAQLHTMLKEEIEDEVV